MKWLILFLISFSAHAIDVKAGKHKLCAVIVHKDKSPHLIFNPMSRNVLRVDLKGEKADEIMAKEISGAQIVEFTIDKDVHNKRSVEAQLISYSDCEKLQKPVIGVKNNFEPLKK